MITNKKTLYTPKEVIEKNGGPLPLSLGGVYKYCSEGRIPTIRIGSKIFIHANYIQNLLNENK